MIPRTRIPLLTSLAVLFAIRAFGGASDMSLTPNAMNFSYQIGGALPAAQSLVLKSTGAAALAFTITVTQPVACSAPCVTVSAGAGTTPATIQVYINPSGLAAGGYAASITVNAPTAVTPVQNVAVNLTVGDQPSSLSASAVTLAFAYTTGGGSAAQSTPVVISTNGDALTATVAVSGGTWLKASPTGSIALIGLPETLTVTADATGLAPQLAPYKGTITIASSNALNKSVTINVTLQVSAGVPTIAASNGIWPPGAPAGNSSPVSITITGTNFTQGSTALSGSTPLTPLTVINATTMLATIPISLLASAGNLPITIQTPTAASLSAPVSFTVYNPAVPQIWAVVDSASYTVGTVSPGEIVTIYGAGLGPSSITPFSGSSLPTSLGVGGANTSVTIDGNAAPLLYTSATQVSCIVPLAVAPGKASGPKVNVLVTYNGVSAATPYQVNVAATNPGIFTLGPSGQAAVLNINTNVIPNDYTVNGSGNAAPRGSWVAIYATGFGVTSCTPAQTSVCDSPPPTESQFVGGGVVTPTGAVTVTIGGQTVAAPVAVVPVGSVIGLLQINAQVPALVTPGAAVPIVISVGGIASTGVAKMAVK
jgi:trimeric autotransporter adhesin